MTRAPTFVPMILSLSMLGVGVAHAQNFGAWGDPQPVAGINTAAAEGCPIERPDGLALYIATNRAGGQGALDVWRAFRTTQQSPWGTPENLAPPVNTSQFDYCPTPLSSNQLYFVSSVQVTAAQTTPTYFDCFAGDTPPPPPPGGPSAGDMFLSTETAANAWSTPVNLGCFPAGPNTAGAEFSPSLVTTTQGTFLFFSSNGYADSQGQDIYVSQRAGDGSFGPGVRVAELSSAADDRMPNVSPNGLEIVFSSNRAGATPFDQDIHVATRPSTSSPWSAPVRIDNPNINSTASETRSSLSGDGTRLYFGRKLTVDDPGDVFVATRAGSGQGAQSVPSLSTPMLILLAGLLCALAWRQSRTA